MIKLKKVSITTAVFLIVLSFQNCAVISDDSSDESLLASAADQADLQSKAMNILQRNCSSCHNPSNAQGGIDYITDLNLLLYYRLVIPGDPQHSEIYSEIQSGNMPPGKPMNQNDMKIVFDWIQDGFKDSSPAPKPVTACNTLAPTFNCIKGTLIANRCLSCHTDFSTYTGVKNFVNAGSPATSKFYTTLGTTMPKNNTTSVTAAEKSAVMTWITNGALNN